MKTNNIILIPIYKNKFSPEETISLKQCFKILSRHTICFIAPEGLEIGAYKRIVNQNIYVEYFPSNYFKDIRGYNHLMLSLEFYERFQMYDYMLIYQLDCFVFRDELDYWCKQGYDYIGAPWLENSYYRKSKYKKLKFLIYRFIKTRFNKYGDKDILVYNVGNGGFSLRKISKCIKVLNNTPTKVLNKFRESNDPKSIYNEDIFWCFEAKKIFKPNYVVASKFALDLGADIGIRLNKGMLPFGCHAWHKKYQYWKKHIEI